MLTKAEQITKNIKQGYVPRYYESLYTKMIRAFGDDASPAPWNSGGWSFPHFPDIRVELQEKGTTNKILNAQFMIMSRILRAEPEPDFIGIDPTVAEVLKQFCIERARGTGRSDGEWLQQHSDTFLSGDGLGTGFTCVLPKTDRKTGLRRVHAKHIPTHQMLWDRHERSFTRSRWCCYSEYLPVDVAESMFGSKILKHKIEQSWNGESDPLEVVRIFTYLDIGMAKSDPTWAMIPGDIDEEPLWIKDNPLGIPVACYEHFIRPGMRRATGRIDLLMAGEDAINEAERAMRSKMRQLGFTGIDSTAFDDAQLGDVANGRGGAFVDMVKPFDRESPPFVQVPGGEVSQTLMAYKENLEKDFNANSGVNDFDRGNLSDTVRTLGENQLVAAQSKVQSNWSVLQLGLYFRRFYEKVLDVAKVADDEPVAVDVFGTTVLINDPQQPASSISQFLSEPYRIVIDEQNLLAGDADSDMSAKLQRLGAVAGLAGPAINPEWLATEAVKAGGYDPKAAVLQQVQQQAGSPNAGNPMQGPGMQVPA